MTAVLIFMVAFFVAMGGVSALADARLRRRRPRPGPAPAGRDRGPLPGNGRLTRAPLAHPSARAGQVLVAETEEWLRQQYQR